MTIHPASTVLDNFIWEGLTTNHRHLAIGTSFAKRYPPDMAFFAGIPARTDEAIRDLHQIVAPGEVIAIGGIEPQVDLPDWKLIYELVINQMVSTRSIVEPDSTETILDLTTADVPDMLHLIELTEPGPFLPRTIELGRYVGIRKDGQLVAMAGERCYPLGYHEISAVCTHPDYQGKGYARTLVSHIATLQQRDGDTPVLHVDPHNDRAIRLYERLGFQMRRELHAFILQR